MPQIVSVTKLVKRYKNSERNAVDGISYYLNMGPCRFLMRLGHQ